MLPSACSRSSTRTPASGSRRRTAAVAVYQPDALAQVNYILRDFRANEIKPIDPKLLDLLYELGGTLDTDQPFHIISGYRSPQTNPCCATRGGSHTGVASGSLHMVGKAIDIRVPGVQARSPPRGARSLKLGGVGYLPELEFRPRRHRRVRLVRARPTSVQILRPLRRLMIEKRAFRPSRAGACLPPSPSPRTHASFTTRVRRSPTARACKRETELPEKGPHLVLQAQSALRPRRGGRRQHRTLHQSRLRAELLYAGHRRHDLDPRRQEHPEGRGADLRLFD